MSECKAVLLLMFFALFATSCSDVGPCPDPLKLPTAGTFQRTGDSTEDPSGVLAEFPHVDSDSASLVVDRGANTVTVTYDKDGQTYVETWRIAEVSTTPL